MVPMPQVVWENQYEEIAKDKYKRNDLVVDSKNRKDALEDLSDNSIRILNKLNEMRYESLSSSNSSSNLTDGNKLLIP